MTPQSFTNKKGDLKSYERVMDRLFSIDNKAITNESIPDEIISQEMNEGRPNNEIELAVRTTTSPPNGENYSENFNQEVSNIAEVSPKIEENREQKEDSIEVKPTNASKNYTKALIL